MTLGRVATTEVTEQGDVFYHREEAVESDVFGMKIDEGGDKTGDVFKIAALIGISDLYVGQRFHCRILQVWYVSSVTGCKCAISAMWKGFVRGQGGMGTYDIANDYLALLESRFPAIYINGNTAFLNDFADEKKLDALSLGFEYFDEDRLQDAISDGTFERSHWLRCRFLSARRVLSEKPSDGLGYTPSTCFKAITLLGELQQKSHRVLEGGPALDQLCLVGIVGQENLAIGDVLVDLIFRIPCIGVAGILHLTSEAQEVRGATGDNGNGNTRDWSESLSAACYLRLTLV